MTGLYTVQMLLFGVLLEIVVFMVVLFHEDQIVTVTSPLYVQMLQHFLKTMCTTLENQNMWIQQDGASSHTATISMDVLRELFPGHLISLMVASSGSHYHLIHCL